VPNKSNFIALSPPYKTISIIILLLINADTMVFAQWKIFQTNKAVHMRAVHAVTPSICWIGGSNGNIFRTTNGGEKWSSFRIPGADSLDFRDIHGFNKQTAIAMSAGLSEQHKAKIYRTEDGGKTWNIVYQTSQKGVFLDGIDFWDKNKGICMGDPVGDKLFILTTEDGGKTWQELPLEKRPATQPGEACFAASGTSIISVGKGDAFVGTGGGKTARVFRSDNFGQSWEVSSTPLPAGQSSGIFGLHFWSRKHGIAVGGDYKSVADSSQNVLLTLDGGVTWQLGPITKPVGLKESVATYSMRYATWNGDTQIRAQDGALVAVGPNGSSSSSDYGKSWQALGKEAFHAVSFAGNVGYAVGGNGLIGKIEKISGKKKKKLALVNR
jgi:photosystem II stability/assembly factor-like uncharacterized protein